MLLVAVTGFLTTTARRMNIYSLTTDQTYEKTVLPASTLYPIYQSEVPAHHLIGGFPASLNSWCLGDNLIVTWNPSARHPNIHWDRLVRRRYPNAPRLKGTVVLHKDYDNFGAWEMQFLLPPLLEWRYNGGDTKSFKMAKEACRGSWATAMITGLLSLPLRAQYHDTWP